MMVISTLADGNNQANEGDPVMKFLTLLRHAKSSWKDPKMDDFDRPLNGRGKRDAPLMGNRLVSYGDIPEMIISSPAERARKTAELVAAALQYHPSAIRFEPCIYEADAETLIELVSQLDDNWKNVMLVGHNPGLTELANLLAPCNLDNIVTCGVARFAFETSRWRDIRVHSGQFLFYDYPKKVQ
jgi:phosphohistidine phosphatase